MSCRVAGDGDWAVNCWLNACGKLRKIHLNEWSCGAFVRMIEPLSFIKVLDFLILVGSEITGISPGIPCLNNASVFRCKAKSVLPKSTHELQPCSSARITSVTAVKAATHNRRQTPSKKFQPPVFIAYLSLWGKNTGDGVCRKSSTHCHVRLLSHMRCLSLKICDNSRSLLRHFLVLVGRDIYLFSCLRITAHS
jgi:hypothetical protein